MWRIARGEDDRAALADDFFVTDEEAIPPVGHDECLILASVQVQTRAATYFHAAQLNQGGPARRLVRTRAQDE